ncbi:MAG: methylmalonyl-CoA epimerase [bacterium]|nr:methylmalonyl-CoA epimerase [bacterium]
MPSSFRILQVDHIGIAVNQPDKIASFFHLIGLPFLGVEEVSEQKVCTSMFDVHSVHLELLNATHEDSPISKFLLKKGDGIHHIALRVDHLENAIQELIESGIQMIDQQPRKGAGNKRIAFIHPKSTGGILVELSQEIHEL